MNPQVRRWLVSWRTCADGSGPWDGWPSLRWPSAARVRRAAACSDSLRYRVGVLGGLLPQQLGEGVTVQRAQVSAEPVVLLIAVQERVVELLGGRGGLAVQERNPRPTQCLHKPLCWCGRATVASRTIDRIATVDLVWSGGTATRGTFRPGPGRAPRATGGCVFTLIRRQQLRERTGTKWTPRLSADST
jgi:hypothetical protein